MNSLVICSDSSTISVSIVREKDGIIVGWDATTRTVVIATIEEDYRNTPQQHKAIYSAFPMVCSDDIEIDAARAADKKIRAALTGLNWAAFSRFTAAA